MGLDETAFGALAGAATALRPGAAEGGDPRNRALGVRGRGGPAGGLVLVSMLSERLDPWIRRLAARIEQHAGIAIRVEDGIPWQERERLLDRGAAHIALFCGLYYVRKADRGSPSLELLAAPVMAGPRYGGRPVYFSDIVVRRDAPFRSFADLRGATWAYNEPGSHSGYNMVRYHLARLGARRGYFGRVVEAGSHTAALRLTLDGAVDACAVDSTVLELLLREEPDLAERVRVIETLGPSPIPPAAISRAVPQPARAAVRAAMLEMHRLPEGRELLAAALVQRFVAVRDSDYAPIRRMARVADAVFPGTS